jgi:hypothetical protein
MLCFQICVITKQYLLARKLSECKFANLKKPKNLVLARAEFGVN